MRSQQKLSPQQAGCKGDKDRVDTRGIGKPTGFSLCCTTVTHVGPLLMLSATDVFNLGNNTSKCILESGSPCGHPAQGVSERWARDGTRLAPPPDRRTAHAALRGNTAAMILNRIWRVLCYSLSPVTEIKSSKISSQM